MDVSLEKNCVIVDDRAPFNTRVRQMPIPKNLKELDIYNLRAKRTISEGGKDLVKYMAIEGSTLTFLGLVKYDAYEDKFEMTELSAMLSGGLDEAKRCLADRLSYLRSNYIRVSLLAGILLSTAIVLHCISWNLRERDNRLEA